MVCVIVSCATGIFNVLILGPAEIPKVEGSTTPETASVEKDVSTPVPVAEQTPAPPAEESKEVATESKDLPVETKEEIPPGKYCSSSKCMLKIRMRFLSLDVGDEKSGNFH